MFSKANLRCSERRNHYFKLVARTAQSSQSWALIRPVNWQSRNTQQIDFFSSCQAVISWPRFCFPVYHNACLTSWHPVRRWARLAEGFVLRATVRLRSPLLQNIYVRNFKIGCLSEASSSATACPLGWSQQSQLDFVHITLSWLPRSQRGVSLCGVWQVRNDALQSCEHSWSSSQIFPAFLTLDGGFSDEWCLTAPSESDDRRRRQCLASRMVGIAMFLRWVVVQVWTEIAAQVPIQKFSSSSRV